MSGWGWPIVNGNTTAARNTVAVIVEEGIGGIATNLILFQHLDSEDRTCRKSRGKMTGIA
jgi:hypothetical protein